jgi:hypothetical protein
MMPFLAALLAMIIGWSLTPGNEVYSFAVRSSTEHHQVNYTKIIAKWTTTIDTGTPVKFNVRGVISVPPEIESTHKGALAMWVELTYPTSTRHAIVFVNTTSVFKHKFFDPMLDEDPSNPSKEA